MHFPVRSFRNLVKRYKRFLPALVPVDELDPCELPADHPRAPQRAPMPARTCHSEPGSVSAGGARGRNHVIFRPGIGASTSAKEALVALTRCGKQRTERQWIDPAVGAV